MAKRKLTQQQSRRIESRHNARTSKLSGDEIAGTIIGQGGHLLDVETATEVRNCARRKNLGAVVTGDRVLLDETIPGEFVIAAVMPRDSLLARPDSRGQLKAIAANIDRIFIIAAIKPELNEGMIDRYLVSAETLGITPVIVLNKIDLLENSQLTSYRERLTLYAQLGYDIVETSAKQQHGMDTLMPALQGHTSIFVGQSGVGKSSLVNMLLPEVNAKTAEISTSTNKGTHTTSASRLYHLPGGGDLIDSPGVREFGLWEIGADEVFNGFVEFRNYIGHCKFNDCKHQSEPGCAIHAAIESGEVSQQRFDSYRRIIESLEAE